MHILIDILPLKFLNLSSKYPFLWGGLSVNIDTVPILFWL